MFNELRQFTALTRGFSRALGLEDPESGVSTVSPDIVPIVDLWRQPEWLYLRDELQWANEVTVAAGGAGVRSSAGLRNLSEGIGIPGPAVLTVIDVWEVRNATGTLRNYFFRQQSNVGLTAPGSAAAVGRSVDLRQKGATAAGRSEFVTFQLAASGTVGLPFWVARVGIDETYRLPFSVIVPPNAQVTVEPGADSVAVAASMKFRERLVLPRERA